MRIGGLEKNSLIDFAPRISCVVFTSGCNFVCPYCHNPELVAPGPPPVNLTDDDFFAFLEKRTHLLDGVVISGGEPTIHPDLPEFCRKIKEKGYAVKLDTNGSFPEVIRQLITDGLIDHIAMDIKTAPERYPDFIAPQIHPAVVSTAIETILQSGISHEFRTTCIQPIVDVTAVSAIADRVHGAALYALQRPQTQKTLRPEFFRKYDWRVTDQDLHAFQTILSKAVKTCIIR